MTRMHGKPEILAPAGSMESVKAAAICGADAVYIGAKQYSARAGAKNFDRGELKEAVAYCHVRGVKVYLALNTLLTDSEFKEAADIIKEACSLPIDAVIVQDMGLASFLRKSCPGLPLHASTQLSVHTPAGAKELYELGFSRVVLARELTQSEIAEIARACPVELEVFVHGALCMSVSGQCYLSAMLGGRSGNRGQCAQPCRLPFSVPGGTGYDLSLRDLSLLKHLPALREAGACSFKIEGRMKRPEYVAAAVTAAKKALEQGTLPKQDEILLEQVFSRSGFTDGYFKGERGRSMFGVRTKNDVQSADSALLSGARALYQNEKQTVPVSFSLRVRKGEPAALTAEDRDCHTVTVRGEMPQQAQNVALDKEKCIQQLKKTGGTPFLCAEARCEIGENLSLPLSQLNRLRREALLALEAQRAKKPPLHFQTAQLPAVPLHVRESGQRRVRARFSDTDIPPCYKDCELVYVPLYTPEQELTRLLREGYPVAAEIPRGMFGREKQIRALLQKVKKLGVTHALAQNIGAVPIAREAGFIVHGGFALNVMNSLSLQAFKELGLSDTELSFELAAKKCGALGAALPRGILAYGRLPLMLTRNCPAKNGAANCASCKRNQQIVDRKREKFPLLCDYNCTELLNSVALCVFDKMDDFPGADFTVLRFSVENYVEKEEIFRLFHEKKRIAEPFTRGLYYRGVL